MTSKTLPCGPGITLGDGTRGLRLRSRPGGVALLLFSLLAPVVTCGQSSPLNLIAAAGAGDLDCLNDEERTAASLYRHWQQAAYAALDRRDGVVAQLQSAEQIREYQQRLREFFVQQLGGLPERCPLNARTVRTITAEGYRVENVLFESQPHHHVTANLYLPEGQGRVPGVIVSSGHSRTAKTADYNQRFGIMLAAHGIAALCFDPIGQGERSQILNDQGGPEFENTTTEHFLIGAGSILVGRNTARYRVWDAMRAIDYLESRPEIDAGRIGMTGCSGGGTLTSYVMALDDRVVCAAPACYLTTFRKLIETIGPQDAEQNMFGQVAYGLDQPDYILLRAPRPTLISATTQDFFDITGTWDNFRQGKRIYGRLGFPERIDLVETDGPHGTQPQNLATIAHWMCRWLLNRDQPIAATEITVRPAGDLLCVPEGQVLRLPGERSVFDLNADCAAELATARKQLRADTSAEDLAGRVRSVTGVRPDEQIAAPTWHDRGRVQRDGYHIDKVLLRTDTGIPVPCLTFHPPKPQQEAYLFLHDSGKWGDPAALEVIEGLVRSGSVVVTADLRGQGETASGKTDPLLGDWRTMFLGYLLGKSLTGVRTEDALSAGYYVAYYETPPDKPRAVHLIGTGQSGIVALHAAAMRPELFTSVTLRDTPEDWTGVVSQSVPAGQLESVVHGALAVYDLPDLVRLAGSGKVRREQSTAPAR